MQIEYFKRYFGYSFWVTLETVLSMGVSRLVIFPIAAYILGKEQFGLFLFALGIVMMIGKAPSGGLETAVMRHFSELNGQARDALISTGIRLCKIMMWVIVLVGIIVLGIVKYFRQTNTQIILCLIPLLIFLYSWNLFELQIVRYRVERKFALRAGWYGIQGLAQLAVIPAAYWGGAVGMAWGYLFGFMITQVMLSWRHGTLFRKLVYDTSMAKLLMQIWFHLTIASVIIFSSRYIYTIILGIFNSYSAVSIFFGASNVIYLAAAPLGVIGSLLLSMLAGYASLASFGKRQKYTVLAAAASISIMAILIVFFAGPFILSIQFPAFSDESARVLRWLIPIIPWCVAESFSRPFIVKFGPIKFVPILNLIALIGHLLPAIILIPMLGMNGAVVSYNIGCVLSGISCLGALVWTFKHSNSSKVNVEMIDFAEDNIGQTNLS